MKRELIPERSDLLKLLVILDEFLGLGKVTYLQSDFASNQGI